MNAMLALLFLVVVAGISRIVAGWVERHAEMLRLVQAPNHRSLHERPTPHGGGLGIVLAGSIAGAVLVISGKAEFFGIMALGLLLAGVGLRDDIAHLSSRLRLSAQVIACAGLLWLLPPLPGMAFPGGLVLQGPLLFALLLLAGVWWVNLFNFMDGIDGIAGSQAIFMLLAAVTIGLLAQTLPLSATLTAECIWMLAVAAATLGFLLRNWPPARIFMGDVGSTWLGFMIYAFALGSVAAGWLTYTAWLVLGALFATDATVTLLRRIVSGRNGSEAHRSHAYQHLARRAGSDRTRGHRNVTLLAIAINLFWLAPLGWASLMWPQDVWGWVALAYVPLSVAVWRVGAGRD
ncbi:MAG: glycosyl transferase family 4 [Pseudomonadota bacterium]